MVAEAPTAASSQDRQTDDVPSQTHEASSPAAAGRSFWRRPAAWPREWILLGAYWAAGRIVMLALLRQGDGDVAREVHLIYHRWYLGLRRGSFPQDDVAWQYPPGAGLVMLAPGPLPLLSYLQSFTLLMLAADAGVLLMLLRAGGRGAARSTAGAWTWAFGIPLMLQLPYARYDILVTAVAVAALLALPRRPAAAGALAGLGAMIKVWPALTVLGAPRGRTTRDAWLALAASAAALSLLLAVAFRSAFDFLSAQNNRGVEIESLGGTAFHLASALGWWDGRVTHRYGSFEFTGPYVSAAAQLSLLLTGVAFAWLLLWRLRARRWTEATPYDAALTAVLLFAVTSRVISPQYLVWLMGLAAVCLTARRTTQRPVAALLLLATAVTTVDYPLFFGAVINSSWQGVAVIVVRNGLLAVAATLSCVRLWRSAAPRRQ